MDRHPPVDHVLQGVHAIEELIHPCGGLGGLPVP